MGIAEIPGTAAGFSLLAGWRLHASMLAAGIAIIIVVRRIARRLSSS